MANRPRPIIDLDPALEAERYVLEREIPRLRELDGVAWSLEKSRSFAEELETKFFNLAGWGPRDRSDWFPKVGLAALVAQSYPEAKRALIAQGRPAAEVEAMPTLQVAALHTYQSYRAHRDEVAKWSGLPYYQSYKGPDESRRSGNAEIQRRPFLKLFTILLSSFQAGRTAAVRAERQLDALQCIEAIRISSAIHHRLPARLDEITEAPVPIDPMTGKPFEYRVDRDTATLTAPFAPGAPRVPGFAIHYELRLTR